MTVREAIGVGIVGAGWFGERHAVALKAASGFRLAAACREDPDGLAAFVAAHGGCGHRRVDDLLADPAVDAVVIATPHHLHAAHALAAAAAGKAILLEKPMAPTPADCDAIAAAAVRAGVPLMLGHTQRFAAPVADAKAVLASGDLGRVVHGRSAMVKLWMEANRRPWHLGRSTGGGLLLSAGIHALDRLLWLVGAPVEAVTAIAEAVSHAQEADDLAAMILRFRGKATGTFSSVGYRDGAPFGDTEIVCEKGVLVLDPARGVRIGQGGRWRDRPLDLPADVMGAALVEEWRAFGRLIRDGTPSPSDAAAGRAAVAVIDAAFRSARSGRWEEPT
jgi:predicted dehydrogenase